MSPQSSRLIDLLKDLPQDLETEKSMLGSILLDNAVLDREILTIDDFHLNVHKKIYQIMLKIWEERIGIDPVTLSHHLEKTGFSMDGGRREYIKDLAWVVPTAANAKHYARILKEKTAERQTILDAENLVRAVKSCDLEKMEEIKRKIGQTIKQEDDLFSSPLTPLEAFSSPEILPVYVLPGLRPRTVGLIVATGGVGKSFLTLEIGIAKTSGVDLTGMGIQSGLGGGLYLAAEDPREIIIERLQAIRAFLPGEVREKTAGFEIHDLYGKLKEPLLDKDGVVHHSLVQSIIRRGKGKDLIFMDTFRKFHDSDENDSGAVSVFLKIADKIALETGAAVIILHHTNKFSGANGKSGDKDAARGSSAISDNCRWQLNLNGEKDNNGRSYVHAILTKASYGKVDLDCWMERKEGGVLIKCDPPKEEEKSMVVDRAGRLKYPENGGYFDPLADWR